jgi:hypothetical protein
MLLPETFRYQDLNRLAKHFGAAVAEELLRRRIDTRDTPVTVCDHNSIR